ncbi:hypothetical protein ABH957_003119 [Bacillus sp. RC242]|uniref:hypothetical protein n=1 Tax=Bacillus sp. RC242 TaxID=3156286 RepID=UPI00383823D8
MSSWKKIKVETLGKKIELYVWEEKKLTDPEFQFIGAYVLYGYHNDIIYAGITETRDVGTRVREHLKFTGAKASNYICKNIDVNTGKFNGFDTGYEKYIYRIEVYQFEKKESHIWFEQFLIKEHNPPCNIAERTDLVATGIERYVEWDLKRREYFEKAPSIQKWGSFEQKAVKKKMRIEEVVLKEVAAKMGYDFPYFHSDESPIANLLNRNYPTESEFIEELIQKLKDKGKAYNQKQVYQLARLIGVSDNEIERQRLRIEYKSLSELIP